MVISRDDLRCVAGIVGVIFLTTAPVALLVGACMAGAEGRCDYDRIIKLHPGYVAGCELFKKREWSK